MPTLHKHTGNQTEIGRALHLWHRTLVHHTQPHGITEELDRPP